MSQSHSQSQIFVPNDTGSYDQDTALREAGITRTANGSYNLPPVLVQYRDGIYQTLVIEVSNRERPSSITTLWNLAQQNAHQDQPNNRNNRSQSMDNPGPPESSSDLQQIASAASNSAEQNVNGSGNDGSDRQLATIFQNAAALSRLGLFRRGTDNVTETERQNTDRLLTSRIVDPLQRLFDRMSGHNTARESIGSPNTPLQIITANPNPNPNTPIQTQAPVQNQLPSRSLRDTENLENNPNDAVDQTGASSNASNDIELRMPGDSRNIILTVNYIQGGQGNENGSGSLLLYVPSIVDTDESNVQLLVRLATEIALRTISTLLQKSAGVSDKVFESLEVKKLADLKPSEQECPICYDSYVEKETILESEKKRRKRSELDDDDDECEAPTNKKLKSNTEESIHVNGANSEKEGDKSAKETKVEYDHYPVVLSCGHVFGASCLHEWFKTNSTCPLCREKLPNNSEAINTPQDIQITLPNLARIIRVARTLIDNLNNREMTFHFREDDQETIDRILQENDSNILSPAAYQTLLETFTSLRGLPNQINQNEPTPTPTASVGSRTASAPPASRPATSATSILNFVREVISSMRRDNNATVNGSSMGSSMGVESRRTANGVETRDYTMFGQDRGVDHSGASNTNEGSSSDTHDNENNNA